MKRLVMIAVCAALVGSVYLTGTPSQQSADITGPGPMTVPHSVATNMGPEPMDISLNA